MQVHLDTKCMKEHRKGPTAVLIMPRVLDEINQVPQLFQLLNYLLPNLNLPCVSPTPSFRPAPLRRKYRRDLGEGPRIRDIRLPNAIVEFLVDLIFKFDHRFLSAPVTCPPSRFLQFGRVLEKIASQGFSKTAEN